VSPSTGSTLPSMKHPRASAAMAGLDDIPKRLYAGERESSVTR
jgi:hypothetical protein